MTDASAPLYGVTVRIFPDVQSNPSRRIAMGWISGGKTRTITQGPTYGGFPLSPAPGCGQNTRFWGRAQWILRGRSSVGGMLVGGHLPREGKVGSYAAEHHSRHPQVLQCQNMGCGATCGKCRIEADFHGLLLYYFTQVFRPCNL